MDAGDGRPGASRASLHPLLPGGDGNRPGPALDHDRPRVWPFRRWKKYPGLLDTPGWAPIEDPDETFTSALNGRVTGRRTSRTTPGSASRAVPALPRGFDRFESASPARSAGRPPRTRSRRRTFSIGSPPSCSAIPTPRSVCAASSPPGAIGTTSRSRGRRRSSARPLRRSSSGKGRQPFVVIADSYEPHEPWTPPRRLDLYGDPAYGGRDPAPPATCG